MAMSTLLREVETVETSQGMGCTVPSNLPVTARKAFVEGVTHLQKGNASLAVAELSNAVALAPECSDARVFLGMAHSLAYEIYPAFDQLEKAAELDGESFAAHFVLAQLNFKMRILPTGYACSERALACVTTLEQRKMLTELLREERAKERNGIARPWFLKRFTKPTLVLAGSGAAAAILAVLFYMR
jgi:hypothetical protein